MTVIHHTHNDCSCMSRRLIPLIVAIVASREIYTASALCISRAGGVALLSYAAQEKYGTVSYLRYTDNLLIGTG